MFSILLTYLSLLFKVLFDYYFLPRCLMSLSTTNKKEQMLNYSFSFFSLEYNSFNFRKTAKALSFLNSDRFNCSKNSLSFFKYSPRQYIFSLLFSALSAFPLPKFYKNLKFCLFLSSSCPILP